MTPKAESDLDRKGWRSEVKEWRRFLHKFDPPAEQIRDGLATALNPTQEPPGLQGMEASRDVAPVQPVVEERAQPEPPGAVKRWDKYHDPAIGRDWWWCEQTQEATFSDPFQ